MEAVDRITGTDAGQLLATDGPDQVDGTDRIGRRGGEVTACHSADPLLVPKVCDPREPDWEEGKDREEVGENDILMRLDPDNPHDLGILGEELTARYLVDHGYKVVIRNWRSSYGEVDIVAEDAGETVLVEVKARRGGEAEPEEAVDARKQERYRKMALAYLMRNDDVRRIRCDVCAVSVIRPGMAHMHHILNAFSWQS